MEDVKGHGLKFFEGATVSIQIYDAFSPYNITLGNACNAIFITGCACSLLFTGVCMLLSSWSKSAFGSIIAVFIILALPPLIYIFGGNWLITNALKIFPTMMPLFNHLLSTVKIQLFLIEILPFVFVLSVCAFISIGTAIAAKKLFIKPLK